MRARARLAAGLHVGAHQGLHGFSSRLDGTCVSPRDFPAVPTDLQAVMAIQPEHPEAKALMVHHVANSGKVRQTPFLVPPHY